MSYANKTVHIYNYKCANNGIQFKTLENAAVLRIVKYDLLNNLHAIQKKLNKF